MFGFFFCQSGVDICDARVTETGPPLSDFSTSRESGCRLCEPLIVTMYAYEQQAGSVRVLCVY